MFDFKLSCYKHCEVNFIFRFRNKKLNTTLVFYLYLFLINSYWIISCKTLLQNLKQCKTLLRWLTVFFLWTPHNVCFIAIYISLLLSSLLFFRYALKIKSKIQFILKNVYTALDWARMLIHFRLHIVDELSKYFAEILAVLTSFWHDPAWIHWWLVVYVNQYD